METETMVLAAANTPTVLRREAVSGPAKKGALRMAIEEEPGLLPANGRPKEPPVVPWHGARKRPRQEDVPPRATVLPKTTASDKPSSVRKRGRVQIRETHTLFHPPPQDYPVLNEKPNLWYTPEDFSSTISTMKKVLLNPGDHELYGAMLALTYQACCDGSGSAALLPDSITPVQLELLGTSNHRGMETCVRPSLAVQRNQKRRQIIQNMVGLGKSLQGVPHREEFLRCISEQLTAPSRKFAQALGISDTLSALVAYAEDGGEF